MDRFSLRMSVSSKHRISAVGSHLAATTTVFAEMRHLHKVVAGWIRCYASVSQRVSGHDLIWKTGELGNLADGNCTLRFGRTTVLATVVSQPIRPHTHRTPTLRVDYRQRLGNVRAVPYRAREARDEWALAVGRAIEGAVRPLFPERLSHDVHLTATVLSSSSSDPDPDFVALNAVSGALMCSDVPWYGPIGACKVASVKDTLIRSPTPKDLSQSEMTLTYAGTHSHAVLLEMTGREVGLEKLLEVLDVAQSECERMIDAQWQLSQQLQKHKRRVHCFGADPTAAMRILTVAVPRFKELYSISRDKHSYDTLHEQIRVDVEDHLREQGALRRPSDRIAGSTCVSPVDLAFGLKMAESQVLRDRIFLEGVRPDGRLSGDQQQINCQIGVLPLVHGSAIFQSGETQALCTATVSSQGQKQQLTERTQKGLSVHCSFPSFAENGIAEHERLNRRGRECKHIIERAVEEVMPGPNDFSFRTELSVEITAANGSPCMAAISAAALALKDAGIPILNLVAGVTMGLISEHERNYHEYETGGEIYQESPVHVSMHHPVLLTGTSLLKSSVVRDAAIDLLQVESVYGDMSLNIAGTYKGFTAVQLNVTLPGGIELGIIRKALEYSRQPVMQTLAAMDSAWHQMALLDRPVFARMDIDPDAIGKVIGKDGLTAQSIEDQTGVCLSIPAAGGLMLYAPSSQQLEDGKRRILDLQGLTIHEGEVYTARVVRIVDYGAYVELPNGFHALLHISQISNSPIEGVEDVLTVGQSIETKCIGRDDCGNVVLSHKEMVK